MVRNDSRVLSCTVECTNLNEYFDIALLVSDILQSLNQFLKDEIQMIGDPERGSAWTQAFLGLRGETIHVCGDERALNLVNKLCKITGDDVKMAFYLF